MPKMNSSKTKKKNIPRSVKKMSEEMLQETLKKKRECNAKALQTVERLCEEQVDEEWFLENLQFINQSHFDDVTVERAILKLCGYPLCMQKLGKVPSQQYHISTRYNKVFDITERKNFCSSSCYKSAMHIKNQLFTSPLWFRDQEVIPKYVVLKSSKSSLGEEIVFTPEKIKIDCDDDKRKEISQKMPDFDQDINELNDKCKNMSVNEPQALNDSFQKDAKSGNAENCDKENEEENVGKTVSCQIKEKNEINKEATDEKIVDNVTDKNMKKTKPLSNNIKCTKEKTKIKNEPVDSILKVETSIFEWFSLDTMLYLYGQEKLKELFSDDDVNKLKDILSSKPSTVGFSEKIDKMMQLFALLDTDSFNSDAIKTNLKPVPDFLALREEGKSLEVKVRAFYKGQLEVKESIKEDKEKKEGKEGTENDIVYLPLIDTHAQVSLRRKIVLDKLNKLLPNLMRILSTDYVLHLSDVRNLVSTFSLSPHNVTFRPTEWYLVGFILLKLLSLKDRHLESVLKLESCQSQIILFLMNCELQQDYLDVLIKRLTDSRNIIQKLNDHS